MAQKNDAPFDASGGAVHRLYACGNHGGDRARWR